MTEKEFKKITGESPVDVLGGDWKNKLKDMDDRHLYPGVHAWHYFTDGSARCSFCGLKATEKDSLNTPTPKK